MTTRNNAKVRQTTCGDANAVDGINTPAAGARAAYHLGAGCGTMAAMRVYLGSDHAGFELKQAIIEHLQKTGHEPIDCGAFTYDAEDDYPAFCISAAEKTVADPDSLGIVIGGSGNGEQMAANKVRGIRAALAWNDETARLAREHNNAQIVSIGGRNHPIEDAVRFVEIFLATPFSEDPRHIRRIDLLAKYEADGTF